VDQQRIELTDRDRQRWDRQVPHQLVGECWLWRGSLNKKGYGAFRVGEAVLLAHRVAYAVAKGSIPDGYQIRHLCPGDAHHRNCVNPDHLEIGTAKDNGEDKSKLWDGRGHYAGARNGNSKLTADDVVAIRDARKNGVQRKKLAEDYGVTPQTIYNAASGQTWVKDPKKQEKPDKDYPSDYNLILTAKDKTKLWDGAPAKPAEGKCWIWAGGKDAEGYGYLRIQGKVRGAHRMALLASGTTLVPGMDVAHSCADRACINPTHLSLMTRANNMRNRATIERMSTNSGNRGNQRLSDEQIRQIKEIYRDEPALSDQAIVDRFQLPVGAAAIARIRKGETGTHVLVEGFEPRTNSGRAAHGSRNWHTKLTEDQVRDIRRRAADGAQHNHLAAEYGVTTTNIRAITLRRTWTNIAHEGPGA